MPKSIMMPRISLAVVILLMFLVLPCISLADQVEDMPEIEHLDQPVDKAATNNTISSHQETVVPAEKVSAEKPAAKMTEQDRIAAEKVEQDRSAFEKAAAEKMAADKAEQDRAIVANTPITSQKAADTGTSSMWRGIRSLVGLHDNRQTIPPLEVKNTQLNLGQDYIIGPGDQLGISVWRDDTLTRSVVVLPDGKIQYPLIGEIVAGGKSVAQLKQEFVEKLSGYVVDSDISVEVKQSNSLFIYVIGKVNNPGRQLLTANTTVLQALAIAGGPNPFADKDDIKIFRQDSDRTQMFYFRYSQVVSGNYLDDNLLLKRGDVIVVP